MRRREFLVGAATVVGMVANRQLFGQPARNPAKLARIAIMSLCFQPILRNANMENAGTNPAQNLPANQPELPRTLELMDIGQVYADRWGVHNVEMQHTHFPSTETLWLKDFKARLAKTKSRVSNINFEFGDMNISQTNPILRLQAIDLTKQWIDHAVTLGSPRVMINQGPLVPETKAIAVSALKAMGDYAKSKGIKLGIENRGSFLPPAGQIAMALTPSLPGAPPPAGMPPAGVPLGEPAYLLLVDVIKAAGTHTNCDIGNFADQQLQHQGMRAMLPLADGNTHVKMNTKRYDLPAALKLAKELGYTGLFSIEANANLTNNPNSPDMGKDPYENVQKIYDVIVANL
jgi:sugar phosphate isomerase/epimerase